jgi:hypothetical protein
MSILSKLKNSVVKAIGQVLRVPKDPSWHPRRDLSRVKATLEICRVFLEDIPDTDEALKRIDYDLERLAWMDEVIEAVEKGV